MKLVAIFASAVAGLSTFAHGVSGANMLRGENQLIDSAEQKVRLSQFHLVSFFSQAAPSFILLERRSTYVLSPLSHGLFVVKTGRNSHGSGQK